MLAREPHLSGRVVAGLLIDGDHQVDPRALGAALRTAIAALGGRLVTGCRVSRVDDAAGPRLGVSGDAGGTAFRVACDVAVLAAGVWSGDVDAPLPPLGLRPVKGQLVRLGGPELLRHVVRSPDVYLVPRRGGELLVGATMEEQGLDALPTAGAVLDLLREAWRILPGLYDLAVTELSVGFRPAVRDHRPVIGATATPRALRRHGALPQRRAARARHGALPGRVDHEGRGAGGPRAVRRRAAGGAGRHGVRGRPVSGRAMSPATIELWVNGERRRVAAPDVRALLVSLGLDPAGRGIAVARNGEVVPRARGRRRR